MFSDMIPHGTTSKLSFYLDLMYHALLGHMKVCLSCAKVCVMCHDCNHDSQAITLLSQCKCDDITHAM